MEKGKGEEKITRPNFFPSTVRLARPYLSGSDRRRLQLRTGETGVPGAQRKVYPCFQTWPCARSPEQFPPPPNPEKFSFFFFFFLPRSSVLFSPVFRSPLTLSSVRYSSCCRWFSRSMLSFLRVSVFFASSGLSRGHHTLFHAEGVREREGGRARERGRGRERERERSGESV